MKHYIQASTYILHDIYYYIYSTYKYLHNYPKARRYLSPRTEMSCIRYYSLKVYLLSFTLNRLIILFDFTESDPYPIDALPTCSHAVNVCQKDRDCKKIYANFQRSCSVQNGRCQMDNWWVLSIKYQIWFNQESCPKWSSFSISSLDLFSKVYAMTLSNYIQDSAVRNNQPKCKLLQLT